MTDETDREDDLGLTAEYALGLLTPAESRAFDQRLSVDPGFRTDYAMWAEDFAALTDRIPAVEPPASVRAALMKRLFPEESKSWLQRLGLLPAIIGGLAAAALVLLVTDLGVLGPDEAVGPRYAADIAAEDSSLVLQASFDPAANALTVERTQGAAREGRVLELWLIAGDNPPVSLGVLPDDATATVAVPEDLVAALDGGVLAISDEPPGGSTTGAPTGDVLAVGPLTSI